MKNTHFLLVIFNILAPFWHCKVTPYSGENLSLLLHTSETRSLPRVATKRSTANSTQNTDDWKKQLQSTETTTHATHTTHGTHATRAARATHAIFAIFIAAKTRFFFWKVWKGHPAVSRAPPHCTSASVFQTTSILFFLSLMKISLQPHTLFLNSWLRTFAKIENKNLTSNFFTFSRKHAKSRTTAENIAYRTNQRPVRTQEF